MDEIDLQFQKLLESEIEALADEENALYEYASTPLKPAKVVKEEHIRALREFISLNELRLQLEKGEKLALELLPQEVSAPEFSKIKEEMTGSRSHFATFIGSAFLSSDPSIEMQPVLLQEMFGFSDETLLHIYALTSRLIVSGNFQDAYSLLVFLTTLAPHVPSYWIAEGICLQALGRHLEALAVFDAAKSLAPANPAPSAYAIESYLALNEKKKAKEELQQLKAIMKSFQGEDEIVWQDRINYFLDLELVKEKVS